MNNEQFRRLLAANSASAKPSPGEFNGSSSDKMPVAKSTLGSRLKSSIPMTPRSVAGNSKNLFAQQLAERDRANQPHKKFRTSAPKGSRLAEGYVDRAKARLDDDDDDRAARLRALEELFNKGEVDQATYEKLRGEIAGGDLSSTHLVRGLDYKLLEKVRKGEDVFGENQGAAADAKSGPEATTGGDLDIDEALDQLEEAEVQAVTREKTQKKGQLSTAPLAPGKKRTRDQILAELKAAREAAKATPTSTLGNRFKKIGVQKTAGTRFERDSKGREVMIIVDEDGHERRKVRKIAAEEPVHQDEFVPDKNAGVLGMEIPEFYKKKQEELDKQAKEAEEAEVNIFDDAEEYDPLADIGSGSDDGSSSEGASDSEGEAKQRKVDRQSPKSQASSADHRASSEDESSRPRRLAAQPQHSCASGPRNYFRDSKTALISEMSSKVSAAADPAVLAALRKAKALNIEAKSEEEKMNAEREARLKKMIRDSNRDAEDLDLGFGTNRQEDEADLEERDVKLSAWGRDDDGEGMAGGGKAKRKRGPKKRKGDVNSAADVLKVLERRKADNP